MVQPWVGFLKANLESREPQIISNQGFEGTFFEISSGSTSFINIECVKQHFARQSCAN